jgi:hypothetical protein
LISLGSYTLVLRVASRDVVVEGNSAMVDARPPTPTPSGPEGQPVRAGIDRRREFAKALNRNWRLVTLLGHAPLVAILIIMAMRAINPAPATPGNWPAIPRAVAAGLFWLGLSAIWFGLSNAVLGNLIDATRLREGLRPRGVASLLYRLGVVGTLCACQCALAWAIVSKVVGLNGPWLTSLALLILASAVGLALGLLIVAITPQPLVALGGPVSGGSGALALRRRSTLLVSHGLERDPLALGSRRAALARVGPSTASGARREIQPAAQPRPG